MTSRNALIVRGGWDGHQPVETTDFFIPFLKKHGFFVTAPRHKLDIVQESHVRTVIERGMLWAARGDE